MAEFNEARKISVKQKEMYVAVNQMRKYMKHESLRFFKKSFDNEGFTNQNLVKWKPLKRERSRSYRGGKVLTKTGSLKNSLRASVKSTKTDYDINVYSNKVYADTHNYGMWGKAFGKHRFKMPKRQFIGYSKVLDKKLESYFRNKVKKIFS